MISKNGGSSIKGITAVSFVIMVGVNILANVLPINGVTTGDVSDSYKNLFAPAGYTFAIWGLIYILLAGYTLYQLGCFQGTKSANKEELFKNLGVYFSVSSIANALWIFSWHYYLIPLSMVMMVIILVSLILITKEINKMKLTFKDRVFIRLPFSVYFGWITVATIANATALLVSLRWDGFGIPEVTWTVIIVLIGVVIGVATMLRFRDIAYGLVIIWAYFGILIKHMSSSGFSGKYPQVITAAAASIILLLITAVYIIVKAKKGR